MVEFLLRVRRVRYAFLGHRNLFASVLSFIVPFVSLLYTLFLLFAVFVLFVFVFSFFCLLFIFVSFRFVRERDPYGIGPLV